MRFSRDEPGTVAIRAVGDGEIRIGNTVYDTPVALTEQAVLGVWQAPPFHELAPEHFHDVLARNPEVIVLGTGPAGRFAPRELVFDMARRAVGFEVMDSAAAARTFNVLASEGRRVAAIIYPP